MKSFIEKKDNQDYHNTIDLIKKEINELDPLDLFYDDGVPKDIYEQEINEIIYRLQFCKTVEELIEYIYIIFASNYTVGEASPKEKFSNAAKNIFKYRGDFLKSRKKKNETI